MRFPSPARRCNDLGDDARAAGEDRPFERSCDALSAVQRMHLLGVLGLFAEKRRADTN